MVFNTTISPNIKKITLFGGVILSLLLVGLLLYKTCTPPHPYRIAKIPPINAEMEQRIRILYGDCGLEGKLQFHAFRNAMIGYEHMKLKNKDVLSVVDFSKPSTEKRYFLIHLKKRSLLYHTYVAHGVNTGKNWAQDFSNTPDSRQSSLGFFLTAETYEGKHGYSLRLDGVEKGINHLARPRDIVMHSASYVSPSFIKKEGRLGRSWGCPALPISVSDDIIDFIKEGTCLYIYAKDLNYKKLSNYMEAEQEFER